MNILSSGNVTSLTLGIGGSGYVTAPTVTIDPPTSGVQATAVAVLSGNAVSSFIITNAGSGYNSVPNVTIAAPPSGTTATATAVITVNDYVDQYNTFDQWRVKTNRIVDATLDAQVRGNLIAAGRSVTSVQIVNGGTGYTSPTIAFSAPPTSIYLDVNSSNTLAGTVVTDTTGTIKQIIISGSTKSSGSLFTYGSISSGDIVIQGSTKGRIIQKNESSILISVLKGTFKNSSILANVAITGTSGQFTCTNTTLAVNDLIRITGTFSSGSITGYTSGTVYKVSSVTGTSPNVTGFTLTTESGTAIVTTVGSSPTGATYTANPVITSPGNIAFEVDSVTTVSSATARITAYGASLKRFTVDTIVGTFNLTNLASVSTSVADGFEFVNLSQVDSPGITATATLEVSGGIITGVNMTNFGSRYETPPTITITGASTTPAILQPILDPKPNSFLVFDGTKYVDKPLADEIFVTHTATKASARWNRAKRGYFTSITQLY